MKINPTAAAALASLPAFVMGNLTASHETAITDVVAEQATKDNYVQVLEGNRLPDDAKDALEAHLPENVSINTYSGPEGEGYSIVTRDEDKTVSIGIGAYAEDNTWVQDHTLSKASSSKSQK